MHARQALKLFLNSLICYVFHGFKTELIISRLEQDEYYSLMKEIILLFANTHHSITNATILLRFVPKMLDVSGELLVMSYGVVWFDCVSFSVYSELAMIKKRQRSLGVLNKISERCRSYKSFTIPL
jgi:hypothetical protein